MAHGGHRSRQGMPAPLMMLGAWLRARTITPIVVGDSAGPSWGTCVPARGWMSLGEVGFPLRGSSEVEPMPQGSGEMEPTP
jgi:hypothetical protein